MLRIGIPLRLAICLTLAAAAFPPSPGEASDPDSLLNRLAGAWAGEGKVLGNESRIEASWAWTLQSSFLMLEFRNEMRAPDGSIRVFEGVGYYQRVEGGKYRGTWFDTNRSMQPIEATAEGGVLTALWGVPGEHYGRTVYRFVDDDTLEIVDSVQAKSGEWKEFGRSRLARKK